MEQAHLGAGPPKLVHRGPGEQGAAWSASSLLPPPTLQAQEMEPVQVSPGVTHVSLTRKGGLVHT